MIQECMQNNNKTGKMGSEGSIYFMAPHSKYSAAQSMDSSKFHFFGP